jgi:hypothetical protein
MGTWEVRGTWEFVWVLVSYILHRTAYMIKVYTIENPKINIYILHSTYYIQKSKCILYILHTTYYKLHTTYYIPYTTYHTSHLIPHTSYLTPHTSHLITHTSHLIPQTSYLIPHTSYRIRLSLLAGFLKSSPGGRVLLIPAHRTNRPG